MMRGVDAPVLVGFAVLIAVWVVGASIERFHHLAKPAAVLAVLALIAEALMLFLR